MSLTEDTTNAGPSSHKVTPASVDTPSDTGTTVDSFSELITVFDEAIKTDHKCDSCDMLVKNMDKHTNINRCRSLPFPYTNKIAKTTVEQERIWAAIENRPEDEPAPSR